MSTMPEQLAERPQMTRLVLSRASKRIVVLFIVLGVLISVGSIVASAVTSAKATKTSHDLASAHDVVVVAFQRFGAESQACAGQLACLHEADGRLAAALEHFGQQVDALKFPATAVDEAQQVRVATTNIVVFTRQLEGADPATYNRTLPQLQALANRFDADYQALVNELP